MALDKVIDSTELDANLTAVADAIRTKGGTTGELEFPSGFVSAVEGIQAGGGGVSEQELLDAMAAKTWPSGNITLTGTTVAAEAFNGNTVITGVFSETVKTIYINAFKSCTKLAVIDLPKLTTTYNSGFEGCTALTEVYLPTLPSIGAFLFKNCTRLKKAEFGVKTTLNSACFYGCSTLDTLILRGDTLTNMSATMALQGTPFYNNGTGGTVYVPSALIESYQSATNWSTLYAAGTCNFVAIEGSEYE